MLIIKHLYLVVIEFWVKPGVRRCVFCDKTLRALPMAYLLELLLWNLWRVYFIEPRGDWFAGNFLSEIEQTCLWNLLLLLYGSVVLLLKL